jgi:hypothetical protein
MSAPHNNGQQICNAMLTESLIYLGWEEGGCKLLGRYRFHISTQSKRQEVSRLLAVHVQTLGHSESKKEN